MTFGCSAKVAVPVEIRTKANWDAKSSDCTSDRIFQNRKPL